jgi:uncharacterized protein YecT (DUF1311 family)
MTRLTKLGWTGRLAATLAMVSVTGFTYAADERCEGADSGNGVRMQSCATVTYERIDQQMGKVYSDLLAQVAMEQDRKLRDGYQRYLAESQEAWTSYRNKTCQFEALVLEQHYVDPPAASVNCYARLTYPRVEQLQTQLNCVREGGGECPSP